MQSDVARVPGTGNTPNRREFDSQNVLSPETILARRIYTRVYLGLREDLGRVNGSTRGVRQTSVPHSCEKKNDQTRRFERVFVHGERKGSKMRKTNKNKRKRGDSRRL